MKRIKLIASLNNPKNYSNTRHNAGELWVDNFCNKNNFCFYKDKYLSGYYSIFKTYNYDLHIFKPDSYMNICGKHIAMYSNVNNISSNEILIVYDDIDLLIGKIKLKSNINSTSHNGLKSIIHFVGNSVFLLRVGIGKKNISNLNKYLLSSFSKLEKDIVFNSINKSLLYIDDILNLSWSLVMNKIH